MLLTIISKKRNRDGNVLKSRNENVNYSRRINYDVHQNYGVQHFRWWFDAFNNIPHQI